MQRRRTQRRYMQHQGGQRAPRQRPCPNGCCSMRCAATSASSCIVAWRQLRARRQSRYSRCSEARSLPFARAASSGPWHSLPSWPSLHGEPGEESGCCRLCRRRELVRSPRFCWLLLRCACYDTAATEAEVRASIPEPLPETLNNRTDTLSRKPETNWVEDRTGAAEPSDTDKLQSTGTAEHGDLALPASCVPASQASGSSVFPDPPILWDWDEGRQHHLGTARATRMCLAVRLGHLGARLDVVLLSLCGLCL